MTKIINLIFIPTSHMVFLAWGQSVKTNLKKALGTSEMSNSSRLI